MPLIQQEFTSGRALGLWKITESEGSLYAEISKYESVSPTLTHPNKRLEFLAGRVLVNELMKLLGIEFKGIAKDKHGKPFFKNYPHQLSLSHSFPYVAAIIDADKPVGIDLEQIKSKLLKIAPRILHAGEFVDAGQNLTKHCIYWCAKETLVKVHGVKDLIFAENLLISPFSLQNEGDLIGRIIVNGTETKLDLHYHVANDFVLVYNQ